MNINIKATNIELTDAISEYVSKRLEAVSKFIHHSAPDTVCRVEVGKTSDHHKHGDIFHAEVRIYLKGEEIFVEAEMSDLYAAIDKVRDEVLSKLSSSKDRKLSLARRGGARVKAMIKGMFGGKDGESVMAPEDVTEIPE